MECLQDTEGVIKKIVEQRICAHAAQTQPTRLDRAAQAQIQPSFCAKTPNKNAAFLL